MTRKARPARTGRTAGRSGRVGAGRARREGVSTLTSGGRVPVPALQPAPFPIVAIGASAGGLEAFKKFFAHMPPDSGMAFVLIPHLDPTHKSLMAELLTKQTAMPAIEATDGMPIRPNHVYIIPPNRYLAIRHRRLVLSEPPGEYPGRPAIDFALQSLARDQGSNAIGIVLSGTGSHGTAGLKDIKLAGGLVLVQDPATALHEQMPRSAVSSGMAVDYILSPENMPDALVAYVRHAALAQPSGEAPLDADTLEHLGVILAVLQGRSKYDFRYYRKSMVLRRIRRRMALQRIEDLPHYVEYLRGHADEVAALRRDLLIGVTMFFREPAAFEVLAANALPALARRASSDAPVRVWVPACSTGEEAYSLAILLAEQLRAVRKPTNLQIFATDVDEDSLKIARRGIYPESIVSAVSTERLQRYFVRTEPNHYQVSRQLRDAIVFAPQNLLSDPPFSKLDLISCRNALIYLEPEVQSRVVALFHLALNEGGYLLLGPAESTGAVASMFEPVSRKWRVFRRASSAARPAAAAVPIAPWTGQRAPNERFEPVSRPTAIATEVMQRVLLDEFAPAAVLVNQKYQVLSVQGPVVKYLQIPSGELTHDLLAMARESLRAAIRAACEKAVRRGTTARDQSARVRRNGGYVSCTITARPVVRRDDPQALLLVVFQDNSESERGAARGRAQGANSASTRQLEEELRATRSDLQRTISELEGSNEDLRASNEEVMSMNEELQSTNEELESSKEELQSLNEELTTVNNQLEEKVGDLDAANNDLSNLVAATDIAIVFLDPELRVRRFTVPAGRLLNLLPGDLGRSFLHFAPRFTDDQLAEDARRVLASGTPIEKEILSDEKRWYLRRVLPYRVDGGLQGIVVTFIDVDRRIEAERRVQALNSELEQRVAARTEEVVNIAMLEQERIGQELHDNTHQELTGLGLLAQNLREALVRPGPNEQGELATRLADGIAQANRHLHAISRGLVPVPIEADALLPALRQLASHTQKNYGLTCRCECPETIKLADAGIATHLYRIAQEAVRNTVTHAKADTIVIRLTLGTDRMLRLEIHDNGTGIDPQAHPHQGVGLRLMEHRCAVMGARFAVGRPAGGRGTVVACAVPLPASAPT